MIQNVMSRFFLTYGSLYLAGRSVAGRCGKLYCTCNFFGNINCLNMIWINYIVGQN